MTTKINSTDEWITSETDAGKWAIIKAISNGEDVDIITGGTLWNKSNLTRYNQLCDVCASVSVRLYRVKNPSFKPKRVPVVGDVWQDEDGNDNLIVRMMPCRCVIIGKGLGIGVRLTESISKDWKYMHNASGSALLSDKLDALDASLRQTGRFRRW